MGADVEGRLIALVPVAFLANLHLKWHGEAEETNIRKITVGKTKTKEVSQVVFP